MGTEHRVCLVKERLVSEIDAHADSSGLRCRSASVWRVSLDRRCRLLHEPVDRQSVIAVAGLVEPLEETDEVLLVVDNGCLYQKLRPTVLVV
jgi:hypothetical protein